MRTVSCLLLLPLLLIACQSQDTKAGATAEALGRFDVFGAPLATGDHRVVPSTELVTNLAQYEGKTVRVSGVVESTCPKKGCWMNVGRGADRVFVRFLDYAFFVPKAGAEGRPVVFEGEVKNKLMSVEEARHYAEDAGDFERAKQITKPQKIPFVMATGVRMYDKR